MLEAGDISLGSCCVLGIGETFLKKGSFVVSQIEAGTSIGAVLPHYRSSNRALLAFDISKRKIVIPYPEFECSVTLSSSSVPTALITLLVLLGESSICPGSP